MCQCGMAFIFQYLWDTKQLGAQATKGRLVVNCFHFSVSLGYKTTRIRLISSSLLLWIAFIFQYLWDTKQQFQKRGFSVYGCELLSFFSIFGIQNNGFLFAPFQVVVVNCFHFSVSLGYKTTFTPNFRR